jgi:hypothetical protein
MRRHNPVQENVRTPFLADENCTLRTLSDEPYDALASFAFLRDRL